jgi:hypothetical protein
MPLGRVRYACNWQASDSKLALRTWENSERSLVSAESAVGGYRIA